MIYVINAIIVTIYFYKQNNLDNLDNLNFKLRFKYC